MLKKSIFYVLAIIGLTALITAGADKFGLLDD